MTWGLILDQLTKPNSSDIALGSFMVTPKVGSSDYDFLDIQIPKLEVQIMTS